MTREQAKKLLPIIEAFAKGKIIQYKDANDKWVDAFYPSDIYFDRSSTTSYRVKPDYKCCGGCGCEET